MLFWHLLEFSEGTCLSRFQYKDKALEQVHQRDLGLLESKPVQINDASNGQLGTRCPSTTL